MLTTYLTISILARSLSRIIPCRCSWLDVESLFERSDNLCLCFLVFLRGLIICACAREESSCFRFRFLPWRGSLERKRLSGRWVENRVKLLSPLSPSYTKPGTTLDTKTHTDTNKYTHRPKYTHNRLQFPWSPKEPRSTRVKLWEFGRSEKCPPGSLRHEAFC